MKLYEKAYEIAMREHDGQFRKNSNVPYFTHPLAVAIALQKYEGTMTTEDYEILLCLGVLHDVLEDCNITAEELRAELAPYGSSYQIPVLMKSLMLITKVKGVAYIVYLSGIKEDKFAKLVKLEDIKHNSSDLKPCTLLDKYQLAAYYLTH